MNILKIIEYFFVIFQVQYAFYDFNDLITISNIDEKIVGC